MGSVKSVILLRAIHLADLNLPRRHFSLGRARHALNE